MAALTLALASGCGGESPARAPVEVVNPHAAAAPRPASAVAAAPVDGFACRSPLETCRWLPCPSGLECAGAANHACGTPAPFGKPCGPGACEVEAGTSFRICLPEGCCGEAQPIGDRIECKSERRATVEISGGGAETRWTACIEDASGSELVTLDATDGTLIVYAHFETMPDMIGELQPIQGVVRLPADKLGGALVDLGAATVLVNEHSQLRIESTTATVFAPSSGGASVMGTVSVTGDNVTDYGTLDGKKLSDLTVGICGATASDAGYSCGLAIHAGASPTLIHAHVERGAFVEGFLASHGVQGADLFRARRGTSARGETRIELDQFERLRPVDDGIAGDAHVRISVDPE